MIKSDCLLPGKLFNEREREREREREIEFVRFGF